MNHKSSFTEFARPLQFTGCNDLGLRTYHPHFGGIVVSFRPNFQQNFPDTEGISATPAALSSENKTSSGNTKFQHAVDLSLYPQKRSGPKAEVPEVAGTTTSGIPAAAACDDGLADPDATTAKRDGIKLQPTARAAHHVLAVRFFYLCKVYLLQIFFWFRPLLMWVSDCLG